MQYCPIQHLECLNQTPDLTQPQGRVAAMRWRIYSQVEALRPNANIRKVWLSLEVVSASWPAIATQARSRTIADGQIKRLNKRDTLRSRALTISLTFNRNKRSFGSRKRLRRTKLLCRIDHLACNLNRQFCLPHPKTKFHQTYPRRVSNHQPRPRGTMKLPK